MLETILQYLPAVKDLTVPITVAAFYWLIKRAGSPLIRGMTLYLRSSRYRDLKLAKRFRVDPFAIQRQIAKEGALFGAFIVCTVVSLALMISANRGATVPVQLVYFFCFMVPILALEIWWLIQKEFVTVLLQESSRIGPEFRRAIPKRKQSDSRVKQREERRASLLRKPKTHKRVGRRLV